MEGVTEDTEEPSKPPATPAPTTDTTAPSTLTPSSKPPATTASSTTADPLTQTEESGGFFAPPTLYFFVGGLSAIVLGVVLLILVTVLCCCGCLCRKVSPADAERQEKGGPNTATYYEESQKAKDHDTTHHQLQQSSVQPIYEDINENSSTNSQGSPSSKPLMPQANAELYATLDNTNTYAQIQPHIPVREVFSTPVTPDPNTNYQVLNHGSRTQSLRRNLPDRPMQAVNRLALEVEERDLSGLNSTNGVAGHSKSLPRSTGHSNTSLPHPPVQENILLKDLAGEAAESSEQTNIYHILEPPPQYGNLEQIDEYSQVSNTAVCSNSNIRHSPPFSPKYSQYPHPRSATLPSTQSLPGAHSGSPRTSRTNSQSSNSPQTHRPNRSPQSKSPQISRVSGGTRSSESPGSTRGASSSPNVNYSAFSNRLSGQSGHSDGNDIQSNLSERSAIDTLV